MTTNILVTGSSRGIGAAILARLAAEDVRIVGHATRAGADAIAADLSDPGAAVMLWNDALDRLGGRIDVLINNAGIFEAAPIELPAEQWAAAWARTLQVNLVAAAELSRLAVLHFIGQGGGRIDEIDGRAAHRGDSPAHWHYAASKAGMVAMTKSIARGHADRGVLAFAVCPGFTVTGMVEKYLAERGGAQLLADIPLGRAATPEEVAECTAFFALTAPPSATGTVLDVNGASYVR